MIPVMPVTSTQPALAQPPAAQPAQQALATFPVIPITPLAAAPAATQAVPQSMAQPTQPMVVFPTPAQAAEPPQIPSYPIGGSGAAPQPAAANAGQTYTVQAGDTVWSIAEKLCGSGWQWTIILSANPTLAYSWNGMQAGLVLQIPCKR
jgi:nucleoid-associated protein YgaU